MCMDSPALGHPTELTNQVLARVLGAAALAITAIVIVLMMRIGPVLVTIAPGRGIHSGDSLGLMSAAAAFMLIEPLLRRRFTPAVAQVARG